MRDDREEREKSRQAQEQRNKAFGTFSRNLKRTREGKTHKFLLKVSEEDENVVTPRFVYRPRLDAEERLVKVEEEEERHQIQKGRC